MQKDFILLDESFRLKILVVDLMISILISREDIKEKINYILEKFNALLLDDNYLREKEMIKIISKKYNLEDFSKDRQNFLELMLDKDSEDLDILSYNSWLRKKL